mgnify:CR=1 FL=1
MLYLDDIQHTNAEFLQKFISLCDGTRRIEGVWQGKTKTYDMRGKKFCVCMAGNPYTESGDAFKVPDMLANRADIYNLGDILGGMEEQFALSYIENALTSNSVLAPLALRDMQDVYKFVAMAKGEEVATTDLSHQYSGAEVNEIVGVMKKLFAIQQVVLKINQQYIASAAQDDKYRMEPSFKLQGSYRNMNKMAEKVSSVMNDAELMQMIADHYLGEAQMLTTGAESNLLKLAELRGNITNEQKHRWEQIKKDFLRNKAMGGDSSDTGAKVVVQLADMVEGINKLTMAASNKPVADNNAASAMQRRYIHIDWGTAFDTQHARFFPELPAPYIRTGSARIALELMQHSGGSAYLPETMVQNLIADDSLILIKDAPVMTRELFAISLPKATPRKQISEIITQLRNALLQS